MIDLSGKKKQAASQEKARAGEVVEKQATERAVFEYGEGNGKNDEGKLKFLREIGRAHV